MAAFLGRHSYPLAPSSSQLEGVRVTVAAAPAPDAVLGVPVVPHGKLPTDANVTWQTLAGCNFQAKPGQTFVLPRDKATLVLVGLGDAGELDAARLRNAAAAFARATESHGRLTMMLADIGAVPGDVAAQAVVEGILLARYRYGVLKADTAVTPIAEIVLVSDRDIAAGAERGKVLAAATTVARDLANAPPALLTATAMAQAAQSLGRERGLEVEVFDKDALIELGCGGLLGVNAGSSEPPVMIKLTYKPRAADGSAATSTGHLTLVGKGIMYDAGGLALKPADDVHANMKNDMTGAGSILAAMLSLPALHCPTEVVGYLMCTDNRPSGTALAMGDVLVTRGGKTVEVTNTDAEGRLVMADALVLATENETDAIVDIATLTGACMRALGTQIAGVLGNDEQLIDQVKTAAYATDEPVWQFPLARRYRKELDSNVADLKNLGGPNAGTIIAALFLEEFVAGKPWAHIDIAGTAESDDDVSWHPGGCTGFGARLLVQLAVDFRPVTGSGR